MVKGELTCPKKLQLKFAEQSQENFKFDEASGLYDDPTFRLVVNKFGRCYWLLAHDNPQGPDSVVTMYTTVKQSQG